VWSKEDSNGADPIVSNLCSQALLAAIGMTLTGVSQVFGQPSHARIGVLTPGLTFASIYEGLQEGLARLGYKEGENITFVVEDTQGSSVDLAPRVAKLSGC